MFCYILYNTHNNQTYNGFTVNLERRLRQHNSEIKGGAKFTTRACNHNINLKWKYLAIIWSPEFTKHTALSCEWSIKYPTNKRPRPKEYNGAIGRLKSLMHVFTNPKFASFKFHVWYSKEFTLNECFLDNEIQNKICFNSVDFNYQDIKHITSIYLETDKHATQQ